MYADYFSKKKIGKTGVGRTLRILGNGQSLNSVYLNCEDEIDYMVVNRHVLVDNYIILKPKYYVLADPFFFSHEKGLDILRQLDAKTTWDMTLFIPYGRKSVKRWKTFFHNNKIEVKTYNSLIFRGYKSISYYLYKQQVSMPRVQNVLVASIMLGLQMEYNKIELYGVEHSWTKYLTVGDDNLVYLENPHIYDKGKVPPKPIKEIQHEEEFPMWFALECYMYMFKSYSIIEDYVKSAGLKTKIINKTSGSFIDAFKRE